MENKTENNLKKPEKAALYKTMITGFCSVLILIGIIFLICNAIKIPAFQADNTDLQKEFQENLSAAEKGNAKSQFLVGKSYVEGKGTGKNYIEAVKWYLKLAEQGYAEAQCILGNCYYNGKGVQQDYKKAVKWHLKAAEQGHAEAQYNLGFCYEKGKGVKENYEKAEEWYREAAAQGHGKAIKKVKWLCDESIY